MVARLWRGWTSAADADAYIEVVTPWGDRNVRLEAPDGMQLTLFTRSD